MKILDLTNLKLTNKGKKINLDFKIDVPKNLYKYYALNEYSVNGIKNGTIFFSPNNLLNDVLEGNFEILWGFENFKNNENILQDFRDRITNGASDYKKDFLRWRGVFSMSEDFKNELLWIHYTNESGFCLEFDTKKLENYFKTNIGNDHTYFFPISYNNPVTQIDFNNYIYFDEKKDNQNIDALLPIMYCLAVKENHWEYEKEWRLLINNQNFNYVSDVNQIIDDKTKADENGKTKGNNLQIDRTLITKVILAPRFFNNNRFNKHEILERGFEVYNFKINEEGNYAKQLLKNIFEHFPNCIFQIDKVVTTQNIVGREITTRIEIIDISESYIIIKKIKLK